MSLRFDIVEAWYVWLCGHHNGKGAHRGDPGWWWSYSNLSTIENRFGFKPAPNLEYETLSDKGKEIHDDLCRRCQFCDCLKVREADIWLKELFEYEHCHCCGGDAEHHDAIEVLGNWFARCKHPILDDGSFHPVVEEFRRAQENSHDDTSRSHSDRSSR